MYTLKPLTTIILISISSAFLAAAPTPTGVFNQRFEALFPRSGALGYVVCFTPRCSSRFIYVRMWGRGVCRWSDCLPRLSHTPPVSVPPRQQESFPPRLPISAPPTGLDVCFFFISLVSDFLAFWFSVSSGCARRRSVSTYAAILVLPICLFFPFLD